MDRQAIEKLVQRWATEAVAAGREETWGELLADDVVDQSGPTESRGRESFEARARTVTAAIVNRQVTVDALVIEGDRIAWRWTLTGTHAGVLLGIPSTGKAITLRGVNFQRVRGGKVVEHWTLADFAGLARQLRE